MASRFEIAPTVDDKHVSHIRSANGQVTWATETYTEHASAEKAIWAHVQDMAERLGAPAPTEVEYYQVVEVRTRHGALSRLDYKPCVVTEGKFR